MNLKDLKNKMICVIAYHPNTTKHYQLDVIQEELAELVQEVSKVKRGKSIRANLISEMADVMVGLLQLQEYENITDAELLEVMCAKCERTIGRLDEYQK